MKLEEIIVRPLITEKLMAATGAGQYAFQVDVRASKRQIMDAVRLFFKVDPIKVRTMRVKGKARRSMKTRKEARLADWKKVIVTIKPDQKIDVFEATE